MLLSIGMIVKNESRYLDECLSHLKPLLENLEAELIIVDTGSTDNTVDIAKKYTEKIFSHTWNNDFAEARNMTLEKAKGDWYFYCDADEMLENPESIIDFLNSKESRMYEALAIKIENLRSNNREDVASTFCSKRVVRRDKDMKFESQIHEHLPDKNPSKLINAVLVHYGYIQIEQEIVEQKANRNLQIIKEGLKKEPDSIFLYYHLGKTYNFNFEYEEALCAAKKALELARKSNLVHIHLYDLALDTTIKNELFIETEQLALEFLSARQKENSGYINIYFFLAQAQAMQKKHQEAIKNYKKCLELFKLYEANKLDIELSIVVPDFGGENYIHSQLSAIYDSVLDYEKSSYYAKKIFENTMQFNDERSRKYFFMAINQQIKVGLKYKAYDDLMEFYRVLWELETELELSPLYQFETTLELDLNKNYSKKNEMIERIAALEFDNDYIVLNRTRLKSIKGEYLEDQDLNRLSQMNLAMKEDFYGEIIYYMMENGKNIDDLLMGLQEKDINRYIDYMDKNFKDFSSVIENYFNQYGDPTKLENWVYSKALKRVALIKNDLERDAYLSLFNRYINEGILYMEAVYHLDILEEERCIVLRNSEEDFFVYMRKARYYQDKDKLEYLRYLRKALAAYEYMKPGVEYLLLEFKKNWIGLN